MRPVLTVEGKRFEVAQINYHNGNITSVGVFEEGGTYKIFHDENENMYIEAPMKIDIQAALQWVDRYKEIYETLDKAINDKAIELQDMAIENIETQQPFTPNNLQQQYFLKQREQMGLMDAQEIVHEFMVEDVDLTGGEEIENV